jgi:hypothetical protein
VDYAVFFVRFRKGTFVMAGKDVLAAEASQRLEPKRAVRVDLRGWILDCQHEWEKAAIELLYEHGVAYARDQIRRRRWRRSNSRVLPHGKDAEGIAAEALNEVVSEGGLEESWTGEVVLPGRDGRGGVRARKPTRIWHDGEHPRDRLERLISAEVLRLSRLKENKVTVSEWDVLPARASGGVVSVFAAMAGRIPRPDEALMQKEDLALLEQFKEDFEASLGQEKGLRKVFRCIWDGTEKRDEIAQALGLSPARVAGLRRRLNRRVREFREQASGDMGEMLRRLCGGRGGVGVDDG